MKEIQLDNDTKLICEKANDFPAGVVPAFQSLEKKVGTKRQFYGLSQGDKNGIVYWAGVSAKDKEVVPAGCEIIVIKSGTYISEQVSNWRGREIILGETFQRMYNHPNADPNGYCVENYLENGDVLCMVRIIPTA
jgi:predicted transcriptional regulator YdeE